MCSRDPRRRDCLQRQVINFAYIEEGGVSRCWMSPTFDLIWLKHNSLNFWYTFVLLYRCYCIPQPFSIFSYNYSVLSSQVLRQKSFLKHFLSWSKIWNIFYFAMIRIDLKARGLVYEEKHPNWAPRAFVETHEAAHCLDEMWHQLVANFVWLLSSI